MSDRRRTPARYTPMMDRRRKPPLREVQKFVEAKVSTQSSDDNSILVEKKCKYYKTISEF